MMINQNKLNISRKTTIIDLIECIEVEVDTVEVVIRTITEEVTKLDNNTTSKIMNIKIINTTRNLYTMIQKKKKMKIIIKNMILTKFRVQTISLQ